ncbi:hypothetical protein [Actinoplanes derwentensis]|uniref:YbaB/EbfC DNA-binding family protein n=1 Tax=Actinoplanes derwentensis TaxID=113562 RepID=A0A1H2BD68_9ACTN|nr:hypothetical protein [Actinoplanes derwentensis]GID88638.1 hypothetical protein Ade03nite_75620 [Actinoplanes derwentensis]SDT55982.1 hypothetical protein SAMN04489716_4514 [Actinoplanes derwentensis]
MVDRSSYRAGRPAERESDSLAGLRRALIDLRTLNHDLSAVRTTAPAFDGHDETGTVTITVSSEGLVTDITVDARWQARLPREHLGAALFEAYGNAMHATMSAQLEALDWADSIRGDDRIAEEVDERLRLNRRHYPDLADMLADVQHRRDRYEMATRHADPPATAPIQRDTTIRGPIGFFEITVIGGRIADIQVLLSRLPHPATNGTLVQEALAAFRSAARAGSR